MNAPAILPNDPNRPFLTDGGIETTLIFKEGLDLPLFAAFVLLDSEEGLASLRDYYRRYLDIARRAGTGFILESPTWRCSRDWGARLGYHADAIADFNRRAIALMADLRREAELRDPVVLSGCVGPRGDGYVSGSQMTGSEAAEYHAHQIGSFASAGADMIAAITMTHAGEAVGVALAARDADLPCAVSFTVETDGRLPSGQPLGEAIAQVDYVTREHPAYYMINCAHPEHFAGILDGSDWTRRIRGLRANASRLSHAELDACETLDEGDPDTLGRDYRGLRSLLPNLAVFGGCCGTDHRHVAAIANACLA